MVVKQVPRWAKCSLSDTGVQKIEQAVRGAEKKTSGEIVPMVVSRSSTVGHVPFLLFFVLLSVILLFGWHEFHLGWGDLYFVQGALVLGGAGLLLFLCHLLGRLCFVQRLFVTAADQEHQVNLRAEVEFFESGIHSTDGSTGILIFTSLMEHRAVVLADESIAKKLPPETWEGVVKLLISGIRKKDLAQGYCDAIEEVGRILETHFPIQKDDKDELRNHLVVKE